MHGPEPYPMPRHFVVRFVIGQVCVFVPLFWAMAGVFAFRDWRLFLVIFGCVNLALLCMVPMEIRRAHWQLRMLQMLGKDGIDDETVGDAIRFHFKPIAAVVSGLGAVLALAVRDWRWVIAMWCLGALMGLLMALGQVLRWQIYVLWIRKHLVTLPSRPYDVIEVMSWIDPAWPWRAPRSPSSAP